MASRPIWSEYPDFGERLAGIADGAKMKLKDLLLLNALEAMLSFVSSCTACPAACSAVAVTGRRSATGEAIIARNFDYIPVVQPYYITRESRPSGKARSLEFTIAPLAGAVDGINEYGLCITYDYAFTIDGGRPAAPISLLIAETLGRCKTVAEAAEWIPSRPRWGGGLLMLADVTGDIASLELSSTRSHLRRPLAGEDLLYHTNVFCDPAMCEVQVSADATFTDKAPAALRGRRLHHSSETRNARFKQLLQNSVQLDKYELSTIMADHGPDGIPDEHSPCVHGGYWRTTASLQFLPRSRTMRIAYGPLCEAQLHEIAL